MAGLSEDQQFLDNLGIFLNQIWQKAFPSPQLLEDFRRKSVVDSIVSLKNNLENLAKQNAALKRQLLDKQVQESCNQLPITQGSGNQFAIKQSFQLPEFRRLLNNHIQENIKLHEKIITLTVENTLLRSEIQDLKTQLENHVERARCNGEIGGHNIRNDFLTKKREDSDHHLEELLRKLEEREKLEIAALNHKVNKLQEKLQAIHGTNVPFMQAPELPTLMTDLQMEIRMLREQLRILKDTAETNVEERDRRQAQQLDDYEKQIQELKIELKNRSLRKADLVVQENLLKEKVERIEETNKELALQIADMQAQLLDKEREVRELNEKKTRMRSVAEKYLQEKASLIEKQNEYKRQIAQLKRKLEERSVERADRIAQINTLNEKVQLLEKTNEELGIQIVSLQTQLLDKEKEVYDLREENIRVESNAEKEIKNLKDRVEELMKENEGLKKLCDQGGTGDINQLREQVIQLKMDNEKMNKMKIDKLKENEKINGIIAEKNNKISRQKRKIDDLRAEIRDLKNDDHKRTTEEVDLQSDGQQRQRETPKLDKNLHDKLTAEKPSQEKTNLSESEAEEETKSSEDSGKKKNWKKRIIEELEKGLHLDLKKETTDERESTV